MNQKNTQTRKRRSFRSLIKNENGSSMVWVAGGMTAMLGFAALAVDASFFYVEKNQLQLAADVAARVALAEIKDEQKALKSAKFYITENLPTHSHGFTAGAKDQGIEFGDWNHGKREFTPKLNPGDPVNAVRITLTKTETNGNPVPTFFGNIFGVRDIDIRAQAVASIGQSPTCLLSLEPSEPAVDVNSDSFVQANGCQFQINSRNAKAAVTNSGGKIMAEEVCVNGKTQGSGFKPDPETDCPPANDPLAHLEPPLEAKTTCPLEPKKLTIQTDATIGPGVYCGGLEVNGGVTVKFDPGVYIIKNGRFELNSGAKAVGTELTFVFTGPDSQLVLNSGSSAVFSATTTGDLAGILFYEDQKNPLGTSHLFNSDVNSTLNGVVYLPRGTLEVNSDSSVTTDAIIIARKFNINSRSSLTVNKPSSASGVPLPLGFGAAGYEGLVM